jgi:hypothetical protein
MASAQYPPQAEPLPSGSPSSVIIAPSAQPAAAVGYPENYYPPEQPRRPVRDFFRRLWSGDKVEPLHMAGVQTPKGNCSCNVKQPAPSVIAPVPVTRPIPGSTQEPQLASPVALSGR